MRKFAFVAGILVYAWGSWLGFNLVDWNRVVGYSIALASLVIGAAIAWAGRPLRG